MKLEDTLHQLGADYRKAKPSADFLRHGWSALESELEDRRHPRLRGLFTRRPFAWASVAFMVIMLLGAGTVAAAQSALPTEALFPVKVLSERVALGLAPKRLRQQLQDEFASRRVAEQKRLKMIIEPGSEIEDVLNPQPSGMIEQLAPAASPINEIPASPTGIPIPTTPVILTPKSGVLPTIAEVKSAQVEEILDVPGDILDVLGL